NPAENQAHELPNQLN
nr:histiocyte-secreted-factor, HSF=45-51 kda anti-tumor cytokine {internal fragment, peak 8} [rabbits, Japanese albino, 90 min post-LPS challenge serum, Peptide Partial, 15 aa] [Oryctolagus cuniculus]